MRRKIVIFIGILSVLLISIFFLNFKSEKNPDLKVDKFINNDINKDELLEKVVKKEAPKINVPDLNIVAGENIPKYEENINTTSKFNMLPEMEKSKKELTTEVKEKSLPEKVDEKERYVTDDQFFDDFFADDEDL